MHLFKHCQFIIQIFGLITILADNGAVIFLSTSTFISRLTTQRYSTFNMKFVTIFFAILLADQCFGQERFIVNIVQFRQPNINSTSTFRCVGTVFSPNHILAPASCVTLQSELSLGVEVLIGTDSTLSM